MKRKNIGTAQTLILENAALTNSDTKEITIPIALTLTPKRMERASFGAQQKSMKMESLLRVADIGESAMNIVEEKVS